MITELLLDDYSIRSSGTALYPEDQALTYLTAGVAGEVSELFELCFYYDDRKYDLEMKEQRVDEAGDVLWYLSQIPAVVLRTSFSGAANLLVPRTYPLQTFKQFQQYAITCPLVDETTGKRLVGGQAIAVHMLYKVCRMNEMVKKAIRDNDGTLLDKHRKSYSNAFSTQVVALAQLLHWYQIDFNLVADRNLAKLAKRKQEGKLKDLNR